MPQISNFHIRMDIGSGVRVVFADPVGIHQEQVDLDLTPLMGRVFILTLYTIGYIKNIASFSINNSNFQIFSKNNFYISIVFKYYGK